MKKENFMGDIKISNKLLSWILGCECEFFLVVNNNILFDTKDRNIESLEKYCTSQLGNILGNIKINLHTFIHLAKIKACDEGYSIDSYYDSVEIVTLEGILEKIEIHEKEPYSIIEIIDCLEWVCDKVGGANK